MINAISSLVRTSVSSRSFLSQRTGSGKTCCGKVVRRSSRSSMRCLPGQHVDGVFAIGLLQADLHRLERSGRDILAHEVGADRQFAVATVDEDGEPDTRWP